MSKRQLAEVLVERGHDALFLLSARQDFDIRCPGGFLMHPENIVPCSSKSDDRNAGHVLIREKPSAHR